jgi:hypothetical protein
MSAFHQTSFKKVERNASKILFQLCDRFVRKREMVKKGRETEKSFDVIRGCLDKWKELKDAKIETLYKTWNKGFVRIYTQLEKNGEKEALSMLNELNDP